MAISPKPPSVPSGSVCRTRRAPRRSGASSSAPTPSADRRRMSLATSSGVRHAPASQARASCFTAENAFVEIHSTPSSYAAYSRCSSKRRMKWCCCAALRQCPAVARSTPSGLVAHDASAVVSGSMNSAMPRGPRMRYRRRRASMAVSVMRQCPVALLMAPLARRSSNASERTVRPSATGAPPVARVA